MIHFIFVSLLLISLNEVSALFTPVTIGKGNAPWQARVGHNSWTNDTSLFIATGLMSDVWRSADSGLTWAQLPSLPDPPVKAAAAISYKGNQYIFSGRLADCSSSWDSGIQRALVDRTWLTADLSAYWQARAYAMITVWNPPAFTGLDSQIVLIGGTRCNVGQFRDIWMTSGNSPGAVFDGWKMTGLGPFPTLVSAGIATIQQGSQIVLAGGVNGDTGASMNTVWLGAWDSTSNGLGWRIQCTAAAWTARAATMVSTSSDNLYLIEGSENPTSFPRNDVGKEHHSLFIAVIIFIIIITTLRSLRG